MQFVISAVKIFHSYSLDLLQIYTYKYIFEFIHMKGNMFTTFGQLYGVVRQPRLIFLII